MCGDIIGALGVFSALVDIISALVGYHDLCQLISSVYLGCCTTILISPNALMISPNALNTSNALHTDFGITCNSVSGSSQLYSSDFWK